jgi:hypothetical protein
VKGSAATRIMRSEGYNPHSDRQTSTMKIRPPLTGRQSTSSLEHKLDVEKSMSPCPA